MDTAIIKFKRENYRKQMLASRLLIQRNNERFLILKIKKALIKTLEEFGCEICNENINVLEMINIIFERTHEAWNNYENILLKNKELITINNAQKEKIIRLEEQFNKPHLKKENLDYSSATDCDAYIDIERNGKREEDEPDIPDISFFTSKKSSRFDKYAPRPTPEKIGVVEILKKQKTMKLSKNPYPGGSP